MTETSLEVSLDAYRDRVGKELGVSDWLTVDQARIDKFADATDDHQFIHIDPDRAAETPFGGTIAHGFLSLSLLVPLVQNGVPRIAGRTMGVNYGFDKIRFVSPVPAGARIRGRFHLAGLTDRDDGSIQTRMNVTVEIEGIDSPALVAEWLGLTYF
ncbi:putative enoyl-CoA hydratase 1 [Ruegeria sp. THAF57]|uniref:MaoC family dehydratase n=1 Tax=Ruegeria sp. THAF57 TaxID=2744555 RepID=UPI0015DE809D|nr:MaoC family dehydratase [Ruegeria sp. THAF57]CAD0183902.1 putative enoyl-CoA hydratase 1 [Ruegeria sp. THAF57]